MKWIFLFILRCIALLLEVTITTLPLVLIILLCAAVLYTSTSIFLWVFFSGLLLDFLLLRTIGQSSLFVLIFLAMAFLYERKFEIQSISFIVLFSFLGSFLYVWIFGYGYVFLEAIICELIGVCLFLLMQTLQKR